MLLTLLAVHLAALMFLPLIGAGPANAQNAGGKRTALLIANDSYPDAEPSVRADEDATTLAADLKADGFTLEVRKNLGKRDMQSAIDAFVAKIAPKSTALFFYKGIGIQSSHQTFLIPVSAEIWSEGDVKREGISMDSVMNEISRKGASVKIAIIDAARTNPFERRFRSYSAGLAGLDAPEGSLVIYAEAPNKVGKTGIAPVSLFMSELVKQMKQPNTAAEDAFTRTRIRVSKLSNGEQVPWMAPSLIEPFSFGPGTPVAAPDVQPGPPQPSQTPTTPNPASVSQVPRLPQVPSPLPQAQTPPSPVPKQTPQAQVPPPPPVSKPDAQASVAPRVLPPVLPPPTPAPASTPQSPILKAPAAAAAKPTSSDVHVGAAFSDCPDCPEMTVLPSGSYQMGSATTPFDRPPHRVTLAKPFAISRAEITFDNWNACADDGGCTTRPDTKGFGGADRPVINVSWFDAKEYVAWLSKKVGKTYRLPSEAEWEYAAHGNTDTPFAWGKDVGNKMANCADCGDKGGPRRTEPVKSFKANGFGLYDMAGNAAEWVEDCWNINYRGAPKDGSAWTTGHCESRVLRGGSFDSSSAYIKPTARFRYDADVKYWANGFRVVREFP